MFNKYLTIGFGRIYYFALVWQIGGEDVGTKIYITDDSKTEHPLMFLLIGNDSLSVKVPE
jgi:hypothetical protein